ncbi:MAG: response regulator transcription factor [bacterium]|nr:response regulator transcription factor [bacterium]
MAPRKILIIEDDSDITHLLKINLQDMGYDVTVTHDGNRGLERASSTAYDLIILDLMIPGIDGLEVCRRVRSRPDYTPILMLTCKSSEFDRVLGLELGADDYLTKPFSIKELLARVKAIFRRMEALQSQPGIKDQDSLTVGDLTIDVAKRTVAKDGNPIGLTAKEFDLLLHFARSPGRVYTRTQLLDAVWGLGYESYEHTVNSHINRLRAKIEGDPAHPRYILTVWGVGYKLADDLSEAD